jgi:enoyl-CoA hydratase/carnithine racemase
MPDILLTKRDRVAVVSLNRPDVRNAMTLKMWSELASLFSGLGGDDDSRAVVLTGSGADFCVGADVSEFDSIRENRDQSAAYEASVDACSAAIANLAKPVIAAISGYCLGGGCHLALACDFRFADDSAKVGIPSAKLSIVYGVKSVQRLLAIAGVANAKRMLYSGEHYDAVQAARWGSSTRYATTWEPPQSNMRECWPAMRRYRSRARSSCSTICRWVMAVSTSPRRSA